MFKRHVVGLLSGYLDSQLSEREKQHVEEHLKTCGNCALELQRLQKLSETLKAWQAPEPVAGFDDLVRNEIVRQELQKEEVPVDRKTLKVLIPSGVLAGILVLLFVISAPMYLKRGIQGKMRESADTIGDAYSPGYTTSEYEPYHMQTNYSVDGKVLNAAGGTLEGKVLRGITQRTGSQVYAKYKDESNLAWDAKALYSRVPAGLNVAKAGGLRQTSAEEAVRSNLVTEGPIILIQPTLPATGQGEKIIRTGSVTLEVEDSKGTYKKVSEICQAFGGYLGNSSFYKDREGRQSGTITLRIPQVKFLQALDELGALGKVENMSTSSKDVSQEYANLKSQLDAVMVVYTKMLDALQKRQTTIDQAINLESEISPVLRRIENLKNQIEVLNNSVSFTTIKVHFHEARVSVKILKDSGKFIQDSFIAMLLNLVKFFAQILPVLGGGLVCLVIVVIVGLVLKKYITRYFKKRG
ncbi:MAG: DUF4349 domain-containing protein [Candidatus Omnitrophota bacterium]